MILQKIKKAIKILRGIHPIDIAQLKKAGLVIGHNCHIQDGVIFDYSHIQHIFIGNNVTIAPHTYILAHDASTYRHFGYTKVGKVKIEDNVFIGARSIIMPGAIIGKNSIVGAGSLVISAVEPNSVYAGNPAKFISTLDDYFKKQKILFDQCPKFSETYTIRNKVSPKKRKEMNDEMNQLMRNGWGFIK